MDWSAAFRRYKTEAALFAIGIALRLAFLSSRSLWFDEAKTLIVSTATLHGLPRLVRELEGVPPLYFLLLHFWVLPFHDPLLAIRLFSALCSVASLGVFWLLCLEVVPDNAAFAFFLGCVSSFWLHVGQDGRAYALFLLLALTNGYLLVRWLRSGSPRVLAAYVVAAVAGLYTHTFYAFLLGSQFVCGFSLAPKDKRVHWLAAHAAIAAAFLPWLPDLRAQMRLPHTAYLTEPLDLAQLGSVLGNMLFDVSFLDMLITRWLRWLGWAAIALLVAAFALRRRESRFTGLLCAAQIALPLMALRFAEWLFHRPLTHPRYLVFLSPWLYLWLAWSLGGDRALWKRCAAVAVEAVLVCGAIGYHTLGRTLDPRLSNLAAAIQSEADPNAPVIHLASYYYLPLRYYYLPERIHYLLCPDPSEVTWSALPGYPAALDRASLSPSRRYVVVDPARRLFPSGLGSATGRQITAIPCP